MSSGPSCRAEPAAPLAVGLDVKARVHSSSTILKKCSQPSAQPSLSVREPPRVHPKVSYMIYMWVYLPWVSTPNFPTQQRLHPQTSQSSTSTILQYTMHFMASHNQ